MSLPRAPAHTLLLPCLPVQFAAFLEGIAMFDPAAFSIGDTEASLLDPQQRLLLETASEAMLARPTDVADEALRANWGVFVVRGREAGEQAARQLRASWGVFVVRGRRMRGWGGTICIPAPLRWYPLLQPCHLLCVLLSRASPQTTSLLHVSAPSVRLPCHHF